MPEIALKTNNYAAEIAGLAIFISDQTVTPVHVFLEVEPNGDKLARFECKIGEWGPRDMVRVPYGCSSNKMDKVAIVDRLDRIEWVYEVSFGTS